jgi:hypothetical protein
MALSVGIGLLITTSVFGVKFGTWLNFHVILVGIVAIPIVKLNGALAQV